MRYWREILIIAVLAWVTSIEIKASKNRAKLSDLEVNDTILYQVLSSTKTVDLTKEKPKDGWSGFDSLQFTEAFKHMYLTYGEGHIFDWRDNEYTTNLNKEGK